MCKKMFTVIQLITTSLETMVRNQPHGYVCVWGGRGMLSWGGGLRQEKVTVLGQQEAHSKNHNDSPLPSIS